MNAEPRCMTDKEERAVARVERAIKALPKTVALYFHGQDASVMACDEDGWIIERTDGIEGFDSDASIGSIRTPRCAAGGF